MTEIYNNFGNEDDNEAALDSIDECNLCKGCKHAEVRSPGKYTFGSATLVMHSSYTVCTLQSHKVSRNWRNGAVTCSGFEQK